MAESSDDDVPIGLLSKKIEQKKQSAPVKYESDDEDDIPISSLRPKIVKKEPEDSDDDLPLAQLAKSDKMKIKVKAEVKKASPLNRSIIAKKKQKAKLIEKLKNKKIPPKRANETASVQSRDATTISGLYKKATKGEIVRRLLCRWWYSIEWPHPDAIIATPKGYEPLDGYPGVYVCVKGDNIGALLDNRDESTCPCFSNLIQKGTAELKQLLIEALNNQLSALKEHEGSNPAVEAMIKKELTWANKINVDRSDNFARKLEAKANKIRRQST